MSNHLVDVSLRDVVDGLPFYVPVDQSIGYSAEKTTGLAIAAMKDVAYT